MITQKELENKTSYDISLLIDEKEKELRTMIGAEAIVSAENHDLIKKMLELKIKKKDSDISLDKAHSLVRNIESELRVLRSAFWSAKNSGV